MNYLVYLSIMNFVSFHVSKPRKSLTFTFGHIPNPVDFFCASFLFLSLHQARRLALEWEWVENAEKYARAKSGHKISAQKAEREEPFEVNLKNEKE